MANRGSTSFISIMYVVKSELKYVTLKPNFFVLQNEAQQQQIIKETFQLVSKRDENVCNFLEGGR